MLICDRLLEVQRLADAENDSKTPFKTKYEAVVHLKQLETELLAQDPTANEDIEQVKRQLYAVRSLVAKLDYETLETNHCRQYLALCDEYINPLKVTAGSVISQCKEHPGLTQFVYVHLLTKQLMLGQSDAMKECETIWKILEALWNANIPTCNESGDVFIPKDEKFEQCSNDVIKTLHTLALFYAAQCLQRLGKDAEAAECCR